MMMNDVTAKLAEALRLAYEALSGSTDKTLLPRAHRAVEQALATYEAAQAEPVAWLHPTHGHMQRRTDNMTPEIVEAYRKNGWTLLYAAPVAQVEPRPCTCHPSDNPPTPCVQQYALKLCRAAAPVAQAEPVATVIAVNDFDGRVKWAAAGNQPQLGTKLYAAPVAQQAEPLTLDEIIKLAAIEFPSRQWQSVEHLVRAVERAHGIGANSGGGNG